MSTPEKPDNMDIPIAKCENCGQTLFSNGQKSGGTHYCEHVFKAIIQKEPVPVPGPSILPRLEESIAFEKLTFNVEQVDKYIKYFADNIAKLEEIYNECDIQLTDKFENMKVELEDREAQVRKELVSLYEERLQKLENTKKSLEKHSNEVQNCSEECKRKILTIDDKDKIKDRVKDNVTNIEKLINNTPKIQDIPIKLSFSFIQSKQLETTIKSFGRIKYDRIESGSKLQIQKWRISPIFLNNNINKMPTLKLTTFKHQTENDRLLLKFNVKDQGQENYKDILQSQIFLQAQCIQTDFDEKDVENWEDTQLTCQYFENIPHLNPRNRYEIGLNNEYFEKGKRIHLRARLIYVSNPDVIKHGQIVDIRGNDDSVVPDNQTVWTSNKSAEYGKLQAQLKENNDTSEQQPGSQPQVSNQKLPLRVRIKVSFKDESGIDKHKSVQLKQGKYSLSELTAKTLKHMRREANYQISFIDGTSGEVLKNDDDFVSKCVLGNKYDNNYDAKLQVSDN